MIKTITLDACVEKRVRGKYLDEIQYHIETVNMTSAGIGIKVSKMLKAYGIDSHAFIMSGYDIANFIKMTLQDQKIDCSIMETAEKSSTQLLLIDENESCEQIRDVPCIDNKHLCLFTSLIKDNLNKDDVVAFEYNGLDADVKVMEEFYHLLHSNTAVQICDLHPKYWNMMANHPANVLIVDEKQCMEYLHRARLPLSQIIELIKDAIVPLAKIVIYTLQFNDILIFVEEKIYRVTCNIKNIKDCIFKEALISAVIKCYVEDGDLKYLSEECMCMSVATTISEGLYIPNQNTLALLKDKIMIYSL